MLADALKAFIPLIGVTTDDPVYVEEALQSIAPGRKVVDLSNLSDKSPVMHRYIYWTFKEDQATAQTYLRMQKQEASLVIVNGRASNLVFDAGLLPASTELVYEFLKFLPAAQRDVVLTIVKGLSLKTIMNIVRITIARTGGALPAEVRRTRMMLSGGVQGLIPLESESEQFYQWNPLVFDWLVKNEPYFKNPDTPHQLVPRGMLLEGGPGTGKTMAARETAHRFGIPLYRLDVSAALNKFVGESESRIARGLALAEQESPCVVLMDEVEKIFAHNDDSGVVTRILSQLLWWLSEHRSRVLTIMTTNHLDKIPAELYRPGRLDKVFHMPKISSISEAKAFAHRVFQDIVGKAPSPAIIYKLNQLLDKTGKDDFAQSEIAELVYDSIKENSWLA